MSKNKNRIQLQNNTSLNPEAQTTEETIDEVTEVTTETTEETTDTVDAVTTTEEKEEVAEEVKEEASAPVVPEVKEEPKVEEKVESAEEARAKITNISQITGIFDKKEEAADTNGIKKGSKVKIKDSAEKTFTNAEILPIARIKKYTVEKIEEDGRIVLISGTSRIAMKEEDIELI